MLADPLTKGLPPKVFHEHTAYMGVGLFEMLRFSGSLCFGYSLFHTCSIFIVI